MDATAPLTHHEILALVAPFARRGRRVDLAASDRVARRIAFRPVEHAAREDVPAHRETLSLAQQAAGLALPFVVRRQRDGRIVGSTRYMNIEPAQRRLEIGTTFYAASVQRSALNTECKRLLLGHAFEALGCLAVEFRTHWFNQRSREAIARLGAKQDGILRNHQRLPDGSLRDTVVFSIIDSEWPAVKRHLGFRQARLPAP